MPDKTKWFRTDDFQICRKLKKDIYEFIEFKGVDGIMISSSDIVDLSNYRDADTGEWNKEAQNSLSAYYSSLQDLRESAGDDEDQIVAECIFEQTSFGDETSLQLSEDEAIDIILHDKDFLDTLILPTTTMLTGDSMEEIKTQIWDDTPLLKTKDFSKTDACWVCLVKDE